MGMAPANANVLPCLRSAIEGDVVATRIRTTVALYLHLGGYFRSPIVLAADPPMSMYSYRRFWYCRVAVRYRRKSLVGKLSKSYQFYALNRYLWFIVAPTRKYIPYKRKARK